MAEITPFEPGRVMPLRKNMKQPLIHCITNYVAMNFTANALLAVGARPLMSFCQEEMDDIVRQCDALLVNIGCLDSQQIDAMHLAVEAAGIYHKPWVLDPVGYGFTRLRTQTCDELIAINPPAIIRGNRREIGDKAHARELARQTGGAVVISGETDYLTDGRTEMTVPFGHPIMTQVTAMGCVSNALCAAFLTRESNPLQAAYRAMTLMGQAGQAAAEQCNGTGSFPTLFIDELYKRTIETILGH